MLSNGDANAANANGNAASNGGGATKAQDTKKGTKRKNEAPAKPPANANKKTKTQPARSTRRQSIAASSRNLEEPDDDIDDDEDDDAFAGR